MKHIPPLLWPVLLMACLFGASSIPGDMPGEPPGPMAWLPPGLQNLLHVPAFGLLAWLWIRGLAPRFRLRTRLVAGISLTIAYALVDEWHQSYVPGRYSSATDVLADAAGAFLAAILFAMRDARCRG